MFLRCLLALSAISTLSACSDGGGDHATSPTAETPKIAAPQEEAKVLPAKKGIAIPPALVATEATIKANNAVADRLPVKDQGDYEDAKRGFLGAIDGGRIVGPDEKEVWNQGDFAFLDGDAPSTVNPSLWRQAQLNAIHGLFEVTDGLYQIRGYDLAVMTIARGEKGWILIDPLTTRESSQAALQLLQEKLGPRPVTGILFTHSHADHFGGVRGVLTEQQIKEKQVRIIAPVGFEETAVAENIIAGPAMSRRAQFQFGSFLPASAVGRVDSGIGQGLANGQIGFVPPTETVFETGEVKIVDGVEFVFINAPGTEAPAEFMFYMPQYRALHTAELAIASMHNVLTLRGAVVRDPLAWAERINDALVMFGDKSDIVLASHNWPTWGNEAVKEFLRNQRDTYRWIHDQTIRLANSGETMHEIADQIGEPDFMKTDFSTRGYYGTMNHNSKATYQRYFGWWDGNPANLNPHPPQAEAKRMVELAGGPEKMIEHAAKAFEQGDYRWVATIMNHLVFADPDNETAKGFLAGAYEQLGFQSESAIWRNYYLSAALELRHGVPNIDSINLANRDFVQAVPTMDYLDVLATRVNPNKDADNHILNLSFTDTGEQMSVFVNDGVAAHDLRGHIDEATISVSMKRADLDDITLGVSTFQDKLQDGSIVVDGSTEAFASFLSIHDQPEVLFNVVTP